MSQYQHPARLACDCLRDVSEDQAFNVSAKQRHAAFCQTHGLQTILQVQSDDGRWLPHDIPLSWRGIRA